MGENQRRFDLIIVVFFFLFAMILEYREAFSLLEDETLSYRQILRNHFGDEYLASPADEVVIVYTDEEFYAEYDKYPLRRIDLSTILLRLHAMGAKVLGVDMLLDFNSAYGEDPTLEDALRQVENVLLVSQAEIVGNQFRDLNTAIDRFADLTEHGYSNISSNSAISESIVRLRIHPEMVDRYDAWPFVVEAVSMYLDEEPELREGVLRIGPDINVQLDQFNDLYIDYPLLPAFGDGEGTVNLHEVIGISASDLLFVNDEEELRDLAYLVDGKIVLIGEVAEVAHDEFETPVGNDYGVEVIANSITTILRGGPLRPAPLWLELSFGFLLLGIFLWTRRIQNPLPRNAFSGLAMLGYILLTTYFFVASGLVVSMSYVLLASIFSLLAINIRFYISEMGQKAMIRDMFGQYLSPKVVADLVRDPGRVQLGGEERDMTAYFSDIAGFSSISENLTPTELVQVLNDYLTEMCNIIIGYEGTVDKFEGDAIIAFWGAPTVQADHARLACYSAIDMNHRLVELRHRWADEGVPQLRVRMGLNSGAMVVGNMGSFQRMNYTIMGDAVNLAARLEGATKAYGSRMMISQNTYDRCCDDIDVRELDTIRVVGKSESVTVYELLDKKNQTPFGLADLVEQFGRGLALYKNGDFRAAKTAFEKCLEIDDQDGPARTYIARCQAYLDSPPAADWDGVFILTEKG
ncbi:MAG: CHASE2 domain-containing protein [Proteobacteria bacterium]|nr:CHASE2 domain-containing protein [Pseudomonadota bacterium]